MPAHFKPIQVILASLMLMITAVPGLAQKKPLEAGELARIRSEEDRRVRLATDRMQALRPDLGLSGAHTLEPRSAITDLYGRTHARYQQSYKGVRVMGGGAIAHVDEQDRFEQPTSKLFTDINLDVTPAVDAAAARAAIVQEAGPGAVEPSVVLQLVIVPVRTLTFTEDLSKRVLLDVPAMEEYQWQTSGYRLAWFGLSSTGGSLEDEREPTGWLVDAASGMVIRRWSQRVNDQIIQASQGIGRSLFHGTVALNATQNLETQAFDLTDATRGAGGGNSTRNLDNSTSYKSAASMTYKSSSNVWGDGRRYDAANGSASANGQTAAVDVAFAVERAWDTLAGVYGQAGLDGKGSSIDTRVHFGINQEAAFWLKTAKAAFFGDGAASSTATPTDLETVAHELGHGMWFSLIESEGFDGGEAGGVGEGHGDIVASIVEFYYLGAKGSGPVLADVEAAWNWRPRMVDPARVGGMREWDSTAGGRPEHTVGAIYGRLFVLLSRGAPSDRANPTYSKFFPNGMAGLGVQEAGQVWYVATAGYLPDEPNFFELRGAFLQAAEYLYGSESMGVRITQNAFAAVGLGAPAVDSVPPSIPAVTLSDIDEGEGSMLVSATANDDTGVLRIDFQIDGQPAFSRTKAPYSGYVSIAKLAPGTHTVLARALDYTAKAGVSSASFGTRGVNQLIADGGFEDGGKWLTTPGVVLQSSTMDSFLGSRHAAFTGNASLWQKVQISETATSANLSFRLRVESAVPVVGDRLEAQIRNEQGVVVETLATIFDSATASDALAKDYSKRTFNLMAYRGKTVELRFTSTVAAGVPKFRIDNVSLVSDEPLSAIA
ncbi:MAG: M4 family metallopeptidase, partial [Acidobacteriia bacterium]|nr:M4 family metallopeptidase [Terriglobia bacterium]